MLLIENEQLTESVKEGQNWYIQGIFAQSDVVNKNRRIYPDPILEREIREFNEKMVATRRAVGELSHPQHSSINPDRVAILIESIEKDGKDYIGKAKVLNTPCGKITQAMLEGGVILGVSTRGTGSVKPLKNGINEVQDDFKLYAIDVVMNPSAPKALVDAIYEDHTLDEYLHDAVLFEEFCQYLKQKKKIKQMPNKQARDEAIYNAFKRILQNLYK